jgi:hypothetical protein
VLPSRRIDSTCPSRPLPGSGRAGCRSVWQIETDLTRFCRGIRGEGAAVQAGAPCRPGQANNAPPQAQNKLSFTCRFVAGPFDWMSAKGADHIGS